MKVIIDGVEYAPLTGKKIQLEDFNFRVNSDGWKKITVEGEKYLVNPEEDIWEIFDGDYRGEQLFTWEAAMRETKKVGKRLPSDEEFEEVLNTKEDIKNVTFLGYRYTDGTFFFRGTFAYLWSSSQSGSTAWYRHLYSGDSTVDRITNAKALGFSVRCVNQQL